MLAYPLYYYYTTVSSQFSSLLADDWFLILSMWPRLAWMAANLDMASSSRSTPSRCPESGPVGRFSVWPFPSGMRAFWAAWA